MKQLTLENIKTVALDLKAKIKKNQIILINGNLGSGKTTLIKNMFENYNVKSPSFLYLLQYGENIFHMDAYNIKSQQHFLSFDIPHILENGCLIIEWGILVKDFIKDFECNVLEFEIIFKNDQRFIKEIKGSL